MLLAGIFEGLTKTCLHLKSYPLFSSAYDYVLPARGKLTALTDIQIAVPEGCYGRVGEY